MSKLIITKTEKDGIEFYVSKTGDESGMSIRGLARCCGVRHSSIQKLLDGSMVAPGIAFKILQPFDGNVFITSSTENNGSQTTENNAKIIRSEVCAAIISYYAFESKNVKNDVAKNTLAKFATIGIEKWIKQIVGFDDKHQDLMETLSLIYEEVKELKALAPLAKNYIKVKDGVKAELPGLVEILDSLEEDCKPDLTTCKSVTLSDWLLTKKVKLTRGGYCAFGRMVAETYKTMRRDLPNKGNRKKANGKWSMNVRLYGEKDFPILESALKQFVAVG